MLYSSKTFIYKTKGKTMYTATAIYQNGEIGYGEGEGLLYAIDDCASSIPSIFENEIVEILILNGAEINQIKGRVYLNDDGVMSIT